MKHYTAEQLENIRRKMQYGDQLLIANRERRTEQYVSLSLNGKVPQSRKTVLAIIQAAELLVKLKELFQSKDIGCLEDLKKLQS